MKKRFFIILLFLTACLTSVQLGLSHYLATAGERLHYLETESAQCQTENDVLKEEIQTAGSLEKIAQRAATLGMTKTKDFLSLSPDIAVALGY